MPQVVSIAVLPATNATEKTVAAITVTQPAKTLLQLIHVLPKVLAPVVFQHMNV